MAAHRRHVAGTRTGSADDAARPRARTRRSTRPGGRTTKARTLGELALHVATVPGAVAELASSPSPAQAPQFGPDPSPTSAAELVPALDQSIAKAKAGARRMDDATLTETWRLMQRRSGAAGDSARGVPALGHAQPLVSPPRPADGVSARARRPGSLDLRSERGRESVRVTRRGRASGSRFAHLLRLAGLVGHGIRSSQPGRARRRWNNAAASLVPL